ncbi:hypothetical protein UC34_01000 [Pandoraea vervacti]|uniref:Surface presentation of antigen domain-containing protein n=1 Tax=Pandoraea vervacti TaxID=656178 RepID=A0ABN4FKV4_9BURK|nr:hypothetical protein [Pandoraea vervacti]AJP55949.1 hypothetical protein UC34_01000 [Pandoraea vervacti]
MGPMSEAVTVAASVGPTAPGLQQSDEKSMRDRVDEARRQHDSDRREHETPLDAALVWLMHVPQERAAPLSFDERRGAPRTDNDSEASSRKRAAEDAERAERVERIERRLRDEAGIAAERRAAKASESPPPLARTGDAHAAGAPSGPGDAGGGTADPSAAAHAGEQAVANAKEAQTVPSATDAARSAQAMPESEASRPRRHGMAEPGPSGMPGLALPNAQRPALHRPAQSAPPRLPRGAQSPAHLLLPRDEGATRTPGAGESLRYAFGSWGRGHFVNVQVVQTDGRRSFVLGASDLVVQRRLSAALPGAADGVSLPRGPQGMDPHAVKAIESMGENADEAS